MGGSIRRRRWTMALTTLFIVADLVWYIGARLPNGPDSIDVGSLRMVALTIDDGPDPRFTPQILDDLAARGAHATFFVVGDAASAHPELLRREVVEGHEIGNHTATHPLVRELSYDDAMAEIAGGQAAVEAITGVRPTLFRPPRGDITVLSMKAVTDSGLEPIHWAVCLENSGAATPQAMADRVMSRIGPGSIILMHDGRLDRATSVEALSLLLDQLSAQGYQVVTVGELMAAAVES